MQGIFYFIYFHLFSSGIKYTRDDPYCLLWMKQYKHFYQNLLLLFLKFRIDILRISFIEMFMAIFFLKKDKKKKKKKGMFSKLLVVKRNQMCTKYGRKLRYNLHISGINLFYLTRFLFIPIFPIFFLGQIECKVCGLNVNKPIHSYQM